MIAGCSPWVIARARSRSSFLICAGVRCEGEPSGAFIRWYQPFLPRGQTPCSRSIQPGRLPANTGYIKSLHSNMAEFGLEVPKCRAWDGHQPRFFVCGRHAMEDDDRIERREALKNSAWVTVLTDSDTTDGLDGCWIAPTNEEQVKALDPGETVDDLIPAQRRFWLHDLLLHDFGSKHDRGRDKTTPTAPAGPSAD